jgi:hypothetical protein
MKCVACGGESLVEGSLGSGYGTDDLRFRPADNSYLKTMFGVGSNRVRAYACARCGHLQLAVEFKEEDLQRFLEFEGRQPSVLERLNEEHDEPPGRGG